MKARIPTEHEEQREFVRWFRLAHPGVRIFAIPNGGFRAKSVAARMKAEGVSPGVPDLFIPAWRLWVEMKRSKGGSQSAEQRDWEAYLIEAGYQCRVCRGAASARSAVEEFLATK